MTTTYPALIGSEKQIAWATDIRTTLVGYLDRCLEDREPHDDLPSFGVTAERLSALRDEALAQTSAAWWIDRRHYDKVGFTKKLVAGTPWPAQMVR